MRIKGEYNAAGISLIVSLFGAVDKPTSMDPVEMANTAAQFVKKYGLDGVDVDYEVIIDLLNAVQHQLIYVSGSRGNACWHGCRLDHNFDQDTARTAPSRAVHHLPCTYANLSTDYQCLV